MSQSCLLLNNTLTPTQLGNCTHITLRAYGTFDHYVNGIGYITGSNALDLGKIGIDEGLLVVNISMIVDAFTRIHETVVIEQPVGSDGVSPSLSEVGELTVSCQTDSSRRIFRSTPWDHL